MSVTIATKLGAGSQYVPSIETNGVSQDAISLTKVFTGLLDSIGESIYLSREYSLPQETLEAFSEIEAQCSVDNWDGEGAVAIKKLTVVKAKEFIKTLPKRFQSPEIEAEFNGSISMEWYRNPKQIFVLRINDVGVIRYAGLFGPVKSTSGTSYFDGYGPNEILGLIKRV